MLALNPIGSGLPGDLRASPVFGNFLARDLNQTHSLRHQLGHDASFASPCTCYNSNDHGMMAQRRTIMVAKITLALTLMFLAVAAVPASAGLGEGGQTASPPEGKVGSGGGNLVTRW
jgi:hypothetical protein